MIFQKGEIETFGYVRSADLKYAKLAAINLEDLVIPDGAKVAVTEFEDVIEVVFSYTKNETVLPENQFSLSQKNNSETQEILEIEIPMENIMVFVPNRDNEFSGKVILDKTTSELVVRVFPTP